MFGSADGGMFGEDGMLGSSYGITEQVVTKTAASHAPQVPGTVVGMERALPAGVRAVPGTVVGAERALPTGVRAVPGTVVGAERPLPAGVKAVPGSTVVAVPMQQVPGPRPTQQQLNQGRGGYSIDNGLPPLPTGAPMYPGGHEIRLNNNMPLPGRPVAAPPYPSDVQRYGIRDGWGAPAQLTHKDYPSANYARDGYVYRVYSDHSIDVYVRGKLVTQHMTAESAPAAYKAISDELRTGRKVDPAVIAAAINATALVATTALAPHPKHRKKFDAGPMPVPPAEPVASPGVPVWVWVAGGSVLALGVGFMVFGGKKDHDKREAA